MKQRSCFHAKVPSNNEQMKNAKILFRSRTGSKRNVFQRFPWGVNSSILPGPFSSCAVEKHPITRKGLDLVSAPFLIPHEVSRKAFMS